MIAFLIYFPSNHGEAAIAHFPAVVAVARDTRQLCAHDKEPEELVLSGSFYNLTDCFVHKPNTTTMQPTTLKRSGILLGFYLRRTG